MISIIIVVSWQGHHPTYCAHFISACASFSEKVYVICPNEANPIAQLGEQSHLVEKTSILRYANLASKSGFLKFQDIRQDFQEIRLLVRSAMHDNPGKKVFIFHTSLDCLFIGISHLPVLFFNIRKLLPWPFSGWLLAPDRKWPLKKSRQYLSSVLGQHDQRNKCQRLLNSVCENALTTAGNMLRYYHRWQTSLVLRRSYCQQIALLDERYITSLAKQTGKRVVLFPDVTSTEMSDPPPDIVSEISRIRPGSIVVGMLGELSRRKGIELLIEVIQNHNTDGLFFVLAGACDPSVLSEQHRAFLDQEIYTRKNVIFSPVSIPTENDFNAIINSCDILYCVYQDHLHSSNVISKAAAFKKPVLVNSGELMAKRIEDYRMGEVLADQTPEECLSALRHMSSPTYLHEIRDNAMFTQYMTDHSFDKLQQGMAELSAN